MEINDFVRHVNKLGKDVVVVYTNDFQEQVYLGYRTFEEYNPIDVCVEFNASGDARILPAIDYLSTEQQSAVYEYIDSSNMSDRFRDVPTYEDLTDEWE